MTIYNNPSYLVSKQYHTTDNLNARIKLHTLYSTGKRDWYGFVRQLLDLQPSCTLLAMGEGNGLQWRSQTATLPEDFNAILSDISIGMIAEAEYYLRGQPGFGFVCFDAQNTPFGDCQFDLVTANHMLYHVPDPDLAIAEAARLLKPDGRFIAATNGIGHMENLQELLVEFEPGFQKRYRYFDAFTLESGVGRLQPYFETVERIDFDENLWVTNAEDLADYAFSMPALQEAILLDRKPELVSYFELLIARDGGIFIAKVTGVLIGTKPTRHR
ncbi:MAG: methyltransferase domain-containing protein [Anaerolineaceae bacterium]